MKKVRTPEEAHHFQQIPNIGPSMEGDFKLLGIKTPAGLKGKDPYALYLKISKINPGKDGSHQDPCVLDTYMAAVDFMNGAGPRPWWKYTAERKRRYPEIRRRKA